MVWKNTWTVYIIGFVSILGLGFLGGWSLRGYFSGRVMDGVREQLSTVTGEFSKSAKYISELERINRENTIIITDAETRINEISENNQQLRDTYDELVSSNVAITDELSRVQQLYRESTGELQRNSELISRCRELIGQLKSIYVP